ncbi:MAG: hypothetical protein A3J79_10705 [Elusimicrobia bacterium RIFOXYB2_FULL_62_6]|nr:MAG: hypothetical protein A3J79_10705 [Elusimicrobia bacterium RIFOXYB2_FULL_62_6]
MAFQKVAPACFAALLLAGCAAGPREYLKSGYVPPARVAVLPLNNLTTDLDGPAIVQFWFDQRLSDKKGYSTVPLAEVETALREQFGVTDGGQLSAVAPAKLGERLRADALIYGELLEFNYQTAGFLNARKVRAKFRMVDAATGELLWECEGVGANSSAAASSSQALKAGLAALGSQLAEKATGSPLRYETWDMVWNAIEFLPAARR